jgi:pimeloyl-ACP methyl ester carboxylesterase
MAAEARPFTIGGAPALRGETAGEGPPAVLCHGITATRRYVLHGSKALARAGYAVTTYDARGHGESDPAPAGESYGYPELVADLERVVEEEVGDERFLLGGHSMGAHTAIAYALRHPDRLAGLALIGPVYTGTIEPGSLRYWDGLAMALEAGGIDGFLDYLEREQGIDPRWRDSVLRFTRQRLELQEHPEALAQALREVTRSRPFGSLQDLGALAVPTLVVASNDDADPGHPYEAAGVYAQALPDARLLSEAEGESPLAWQGGKLSRALAAFYAEALSSPR